MQTYTGLSWKALEMNVQFLGSSQYYIGWNFYFGNGPEEKTRLWSSHSRICVRRNAAFQLLACTEGFYILCSTRLNFCAFFLCPSFVHLCPSNINWLGLDLAVWLLQDCNWKDEITGNHVAQDGASWTLCYFSYFSNLPSKITQLWRFHNLRNNVVLLHLEIFALCLILLPTVLYTRHVQSSVLFALLFLYLEVVITKLFQYPLWNKQLCLSIIPWKLCFLEVKRLSAIYERTRLLCEILWEIIHIPRCANEIFHNFINMN